MLISHIKQLNYLPIQLIDKYTALDMTTVLSITIISIIVLMIIRALRNVMAPPFVIATDHSRDYFDVPTMFKKSVSTVVYISWH